MEQFQLDLKHYQAKLTPAEIQQQALERRQRLAKRKATRKKRVREIVVNGKHGKPGAVFCQELKILISVLEKIHLRLVSISSKSTFLLY